MRETLFRGKRVDNDEWAVSGDIFLGGKRKYIYIPNPDTDMSAKAYLCREVIPETVGQYTGLTDKNGKKIFEGDIVKHYNRIYMGEPDFYTVVLIEWDEEKYRYRQRKNNGECYAVANNCVFEIIGNIHDNPELLGGADNG